MWWVIIIIFFCGLLLSTGTFLLQYFGYCPTTPAITGSWPSQHVHRGLHVPKEEGLPADVVGRLKSYDAVKDVPFKLVPLDAEGSEETETKDEAECLICQEEMNKERVSQLSCGHIFHKSCISSWLQRKASCPICRQAITKDSIDGEVSTTTCSPDVEMAVMKRSNATEPREDLPASLPETTITKGEETDVQCCSHTDVTPPPRLADAQEAL